jgi:hypothetical protein
MCVRMFMLVLMTVFDCRACVTIFEQMGMGSLEVYIADFETALLDSSRAYYARKVTGVCTCVCVCVCVCVHRDLLCEYYSVHVCLLTMCCSVNGFV